GLRSVEDFDSGDRISLLSIVPQGTIACVSGFNINLANRTIMLFSPCYTSAEWPHGFRVFGETSYTDENDFAAAVTELAERCMYLSPPKDKPLRFRDDMIFRPTDLGFDLATAHQLHHFKGKSKCGPLGELIAEGTHTYEEISAILLKEHKINPIIVRAAVQQLYDDGLIDEVY
ncbi:MAG: radical SAM family RiPP maturation amino acid epimerase, partial [Oscillospiraceae bacterium]|nr:radical SAM family RiPP maturation amino acid epimerase [Oscillospiraceae bacterium]